MVIIYDAIFGCICITVFQLKERIGLLSTKTSKAVLSWCAEWLGFSIPAILTRHCVPDAQHSRICFIIDFKSILLILRLMNPQNYKTSLYGKI